MHPDLGRATNMCSVNVTRRCLHTYLVSTVLKIYWYMVVFKFFLEWYGMVV